MYMSAWAVISKKETGFVEEWGSMRRKKEPWHDSIGECFVFPSIAVIQEFIYELRVLSCHLATLGKNKQIESDFSRVKSIKGGTKENSQLHNLLKQLILRSINLWV